MTAPHAEQLITDYMSRLESSLATLPGSRRQELLDEVRTHIAEARGEIPNETDADLLNILARLGDPAETAAAEFGVVAPPAEKRRNWRALDIAAIFLVPLFWPVGVILLWLSDTWTTRDKLIGTLIAPGGFLGTMVIGVLVTAGILAPVCRTVTDESGRVLSSTCGAGGVQTAINVGTVLVVIVYVIGPVLAAAYLAYRLQRSRRLASGSGRSDALFFTDATGIA
jgi:uncharacterized membrane protein